MSSALKILTINAMLGVSHPLITRPPNTPKLDDVIALVSSMDAIKRAHKNLLVLDQREGEVKAEFDRLSALLADTDFEHDRFSRAVFRGLSYAAESADDAEQAALYLDAQQFTHPKGLSVNQLSYLEQAGNTLRIAERVTPEQRALFATVSANAMTVEHCFDRWLGAGRLIGELQERRAAMGTEEDEDRVSAGDIARARNAWIRAMSAFVASLELTDFSEDEKSSILASLRAAQARAARSRKKPTSATEEPLEA
ncbi:MAG: hypothetical protein H0U74_10605 [Bradymonadaceae bacterium]|nr:hypothetical protein [Lujinxingiaceae bacterium]